MRRGGAPELFGGLTGSGFHRRSTRALTASLGIHAGAIAAALLLPVLFSAPPPETRGEGLRVFFYHHDPPPPPPPPLPLGPGLVARPVPASARPAPPRETPPLVAPASVPAPAEPPRDDVVSPDEGGGDPRGSVLGDAEGMEGGVVGGEVGGVPGGVVGGVIGGHGSGPLPEPVPQPDTPPRPLLTTRPKYPQEAFAKKIEGTVVLEILIDERGRVVRWRIVQSVSLLDRAAIDTVQAWLFVPARHQGRPVASLARAPISFRIY